MYSVDENDSTIQDKEQDIIIINYYNKYISKSWNRLFYFKNWSKHSYNVISHHSIDSFLGKI